MYIRPLGHGDWYRFDDEKVVRCKSNYAVEGMYIPVHNRTRTTGAERERERREESLFWPIFVFHVHIVVLLMR